MKKHIYLLLIFFATIGTSSLFGYRYTFSNHTNIPIFVAIKLCCAFENLIIKLVKPNKMITFIHGQDFPAVKFGYCLQSISYVKDPTLKQKLNPEKAPWRETPTTWIKPEEYYDIIEFAESVGETTEATGKLIAKLALLAAVPVSAVPAAGASASSSVALAKEAAALSRAITQEQIKAIDAKPSSSYLGKFAKGLTKRILVTTCRDRHWDIFEDENGKVTFISQVQQQ